MTVTTAESVKFTAQKALSVGLAKIRVGDHPQGIPMIRTAPFLAKSRAERVDVSIVAAQNDKDVLEWIDLAQIAERSGQFGDAEYNYWRCSDTYPFHKELAFKYGEALLRQNKFVDAECWLRNAWALGVPATRCRDLIRNCMIQQGLSESPADKIWGKPPLPLRPGQAPKAPSDAELYPDLYTIRAFTHLLLNDTDPGIDIRINAQRAAWDANSLLSYLIQLPEFRYKNLSLFLVLKSRISEGLI